jgi:hypothetical protein
VPDSLDIIVAAAAGAALGVVIVLIVLGVRRRLRRQRRLHQAFERGQRVRGAGTGEQGQPYSLYGEEAWRDHTSRGRENR